MNRWRYSITVLNILCHVLTALIVSKFSDSFYTTLRIVHGCMLGNRDLTVSLRCVLVHLHYNWNQVSNKVIQYPMIKHMPYKRFYAKQKIFCKICVCDFIKMSISTINLLSWACFLGNQNILHAYLGNSMTVIFRKENDCYDAGYFRLFQVFHSFGLNTLRQT